MSEARGVQVRNGKYRRARLRHVFLTVVADRLTRGHLMRRHVAQSVEERSITIMLPHWPLAYDGLRIAHISDFHVGHLMSVERATAICEGVAQLNADLIVCTGDVVDLDAHGVSPVLHALGRCKAPLGTALVLGNHDHLDDAPFLLREAHAAGIEPLSDDVLCVGSSGARLRIGGIDWDRTIRGCARRVGRVWQRGRGIDLLLAHNPKAFVGAARLGVPLTLSGHTHGRQFSLLPRRKHAEPARPRFARRLNAGL
jgi:predicted MPP superfamily phosphohydrolase